MAGLPQCFVKTVVRVDVGIDPYKHCADSPGCVRFCGCILPGGQRRPPLRARAYSHRCAHIRNIVPRGRGSTPPAQGAPPTPHNKRQQRKMSVGVDAHIDPAGCNCKIARAIGEIARRSVGADDSVRPWGNCGFAAMFRKNGRAGRCGHRPLQTLCGFAGVRPFLRVHSAGRTESSAPTLIIHHSLFIVETRYSSEITTLPLISRLRRQLPPEGKPRRGASLRGEALDMQNPHPLRLQGWGFCITPRLLSRAYFCCTPRRCGGSALCRWRTWSRRGDPEARRG